MIFIEMFVEPLFLKNLQFFHLSTLVSTTLSVREHKLTFLLTRTHRTNIIKYIFVCQVTVLYTGTSPRSSRGQTVPSEFNIFIFKSTSIYNLFAHHLEHIFFKIFMALKKMIHTREYNPCNHC